MKLLENGLTDLRFEGPGIWPLCELDETELKVYFAGLHKLMHQCLAMHLRCEAPAMARFLSFADAPLETLGYRRLIQLTRELLFCCDLNLIYEYRMPTGAEYDIIRLLEQTHAQLIGAYYGQRPGEETLDAHELIFI